MDTKFKLTFDKDLTENEINVLIKKHLGIELNTNILWDAYVSITGNQKTLFINNVEIERNNNLTL